ncbi:MAG: hypothetical protein HYZ20_17690 [Burkholderiales bacterium]|nr:hypothetical protein [Burkholderiales bacterium]
MKRVWWILALPLALVVAAVGMLVVPNPLGAKVLAEAKYRGLVAYTPDEAVTIAYTRCSGCHGAEKMLKYCARCGPPFIVVTQSMKKYVELTNQKHETVRPFSDSEAVAITQAWNGLIGNWEAGWGEKNLRRLLQGDVALTRLLETPADARPIELALKNKSAPGSYPE